MAQPRRLGAEDSHVRHRFVDAAEAILSEEGYHGISARRIAEKAGLKVQLLYYYFRTMDDVLLAVLTRVNDQRLARFHEALLSPRPLRALWDLNADTGAASLAAELAAIANHRESIRAAIVDSARQFRALQTEAVARLLPGSEDAGLNAAGLVMIAAALARTLVNESVLGLTEGHAEATSIAEAMLDRLEPNEGAALR